MLFLAVIAKPQGFVPDHFTTKDGLSSGNIYSIIKDSRGFMWFGTEDGLNKFDGYEFIVYRLNPEDSFSMSDNWVQSVVEDENGLWIGTRNGLNRYSYETDRFTRYYHRNTVEGTLSNNTINTILKDNKGQIWIGTTDGLNLYNRKEDNFTSFSLIPENNTQSGINQVRSITIDVNDMLLISTMSGVYVFDPVKKQFKKYLEDVISGDQFGSEFIVCTFIDSKERVWIGTDATGLICYDKINRKPHHFKNKPDDPYSLCYDGISNIMEDHKGNIWISTKGGLSVFQDGTDLKKARFQNLKQSTGGKSGLSTNNINVVYQDDENRYWIGGRFGDIDIIDTESRFINYKFTDIDDRFISNNMTAFVEDKEGNIYFGTDGGGIYYWDRKYNTYTVYRQNSRLEPSITTDKVIALCLDSDNNLWIGMWNGGLDKLNLNNNSIVNYSYNRSDPESLGSDNVFYIMEDSRKNIWVGLWFGGVNLYDRQNDCFIRYPYGVGDSTIMPGYVVTYLFEDHRNNFWIGTESNGLNLFDRNKDTHMNYSVEINDSITISHNSITCIFEDSQNRLWIGTRGGLNLFNQKNHTFRRFTVSDGLPNDIICMIKEDRNGNLWLSTMKGVSRISLNEVNSQLGLTFKNYDQYDGLPNNQFNLWSALETKQGELIFGGKEGITLFKPENIHDNITIPPVVITRFSIFNKPVVIGKPGSPLSKHIGETNSIILSYRQSVISFEFAALNYLNAKKNDYAYILEGFEDDWNYVGNQRKATYTNLDPGKYTFRVKGSNNDGYWNNDGSFITITVTPPWWRTLIFKLFFGLILAAAILGFYFLRIKRLEKQKEMLEKLVFERTKEIETKNAELSLHAEEVNEMNALMEERQLHIHAQEEQLRMSNEHLSEVNRLLMDEQAMVYNQSQELAETNEKLEETNQQLTRLNATKDKLFSIIAHDLKNPFSTILNFSEILLLKFPDLAEEKKLKFIQIIFDSSQKTYSLLENLLEWARLQTGNAHYKPETFLINEVIDTSHNLLKDMMDVKEITFYRNSQDGLEASADRNMVSTVMRNLLANAIRFTEKGSITVDVEKKKDFLEISVSDTGTGIQESKMPNLFEIDQKKSSLGTRGERGTGLGLIICKEFVQANGGDITVFSEVGKGTTFTFTLPAAK